MAFELPDLPYDYEALAPYMSAKTLHLHHDKHHQAYVTNLNNLIEGTEFAGKSLEDIVTGSVHSPMAVWLLEAGALDARGGRAAFTAEQGDGLGRPGRLRIEVIVTAGRASRVRVGGHAVTVRSGSLRA